MESPTPAPEWITLRTRYIPAIYPVLVYWSWSVKDHMGISKRTVINVWQKGDYTGAWQRQALSDLGNKVVDELKANYDNLEKLRQRGIENGERVADVTKNFAKQASGAELADYISFLEEFTDKYQDFVRANMLYWLLASHGLEVAVQDVLSSRPADEQRTIIGKMTATVVPSYSQKEEKEFDELVALAREQGLDSDSVNSAINEFSERYFWFPYEYVGPEIWDEETIKKRVEEEMSKTANALHEQDIASQQAGCVEKYELDEETVRLFRIIQTVTLMQDDRKMINAQVSYYLNQEIFGALSELLGITLQQARYIDLELLRELRDGLDVGEAKKRLNKRFAMLVVTESDEDQQMKFYEGEDGHRFLKDAGIEEFSDDGASEIKGKTANPRVVRGKVRILRSSSNVKKFDDGDILVTGMTTPDYIVWIKKRGQLLRMKAVLLHMPLLYPVNLESHVLLARK